jgi:sucrose synthase
MTLSGVYGFWKYVSKLERRETRRYLEMFYSLKYRNLVSVVEILDLWICGYYGHLALF